MDDASAANNSSSPGRFFRKPSFSAKHTRSGGALPQSVSHDHLVGGSSGSADPVRKALEEELKRKLEENERLNKQVISKNCLFFAFPCGSFQIFDIEAAHQNEIAAMKNCIRLMETEAESLRNELSNIKDRHEAVLSELRTEKAQLKKETEDARVALDQVRRDFAVK